MSNKTLHSEILSGKSLSGMDFCRKIKPLGCNDLDFPTNRPPYRGEKSLPESAAEIVPQGGIRARFDLTRFDLADLEVLSDGLRRRIREVRGNQAAEMKLVSEFVEVRREIDRRRNEAA